MSQFSSQWLALREPADHRSVNGFLRTAAVRAVAATSPLRIVDLGCGTGSNLRSLSPSLGPAQHWTLVDYDGALLDAARAALEEWRSGAGRAPALPAGTLEVSYRKADLARDDLASLIGGHHLVTASALFDLASPGLIDHLAAAVAALGQVFYTVLTYDGIAAWLPEHPADAAMRAAFNSHQRTDKGFGPAAGPSASACLTAAFERHGYRVSSAKSPWVLDQRFAALRQEVDRGWAGAVLETGLVPRGTVEDWLEHRLGQADAVTVVGHEDLLAEPEAGLSQAGH